jgi:hypothetical protein
MTQKVLIILILINFLGLNSKAQFLEDLKAKKNASTGLEYLYNYDFENANSYIKLVKEDYPNHPVTHLISALFLEWKFFPIESHPTQNANYIKELNKCIDLASKLKANKNHFAEATFFLLASHGFIALNLHQKGDNLKAALEAKKAYGYFKEGQKLYGKNPEFYFTTGMYNFYREQYPESHPNTKALFVFFDKGNKKLGLQQIEKAANIAIFTKTTATQFLGHLNIKYQEDFLEALKFNASLSKKFPNNKLFKMAYIENLLFLKQYKTAEIEIQSLSNSSEKYAQQAFLTFSAYLNQYYFKNEQNASTLYAKALQIQINSNNMNLYKTLCYKGLGEVFIQNNDKTKGKLFLNKAKDYADYQWMIRQINKEINSI